MVVGLNLNDLLDYPAWERQKWLRNLLMLTPCAAGPDVKHHIKIAAVKTWVNRPGGSPAEKIQRGFARSSDSSYFLVFRFAQYAFIRAMWALFRAADQTTFL